MPQHDRQIVFGCVHLACKIFNSMRLQQQHTFLRAGAFGLKCNLTVMAYVAVFLEVEQWWLALDKTALELNTTVKKPNRAVAAKQQVSMQYTFWLNEWNDKA